MTVAKTSKRYKRPGSCHPGSWSQKFRFIYKDKVLDEIECSLFRPYGDKLRPCAASTGRLHFAS